MIDGLIYVFNLMFNLFIDTNIRNRKQPCLVYSHLGLSRSAAVVIAYLVYSQRLSLEVCFFLGHEI
jgi:hypothetical protein